MGLYRRKEYDLEREEMQNIGYVFNQAGHTEEIYYDGNMTAAIFERRQVANGSVPVGSVLWRNQLAADSSAR